MRFAASIRVLVVVAVACAAVLRDELSLLDEASPSRGFRHHIRLEHKPHDEAIIDTLKTSYDNGNVRAPTPSEQTLSDELRDAREALNIAKARHDINDFVLNDAIN